MDIGKNIVLSVIFQNRVRVIRQFGKTGVAGDELIVHCQDDRRTKRAVINLINLILNGIQSDKTAAECLIHTDDSHQIRNVIDSVNRPVRAGKLFSFHGSFACANHIVLKRSGI